MSTFNSTRFEFDAEEERIADAIDDIEGEIEQLQGEIQRIKDNDNDVPQPKRDRLSSLVSERQQLATHRKGVVWARDVAPHDDDFEQWDEAVDGVTLGAPRGRTLRRLQSDVQQSNGDTDGAEQLIYIADGTVEAPYADDDMQPGELAAVVGGLHPWYLDWCEERIDALMDPEGNVTSSGRSPGETSTDESSPEE